MVGRETTLRSTVVRYSGEREDSATGRNSREVVVGRQQVRNGSTTRAALVSVVTRRQRGVQHDCPAGSTGRSHEVVKQVAGVCHVTCGV